MIRALLWAIAAFWAGLAGWFGLKAQDAQFRGDLLPVALFICCGCLAAMYVFLAARRW